MHGPALLFMKSGRGDAGPPSTSKTRRPACANAMLKVSPTAPAPTTITSGSTLSGFKGPFVSKSARCCHPFLRSFAVMIYGAATV